jgi:hypothetical protein
MMETDKDGTWNSFIARINGRGGEVNKSFAADVPFLSKLART